MLDQSLEKTTVIGSERRKATLMETQWDLGSANAMESGSAPPMVRMTAYLMALRSDQDWEKTTVIGSERRKATLMETQWDLGSANAMEFGSAPLLVRTTAYLMALRSDQGWETTTVIDSERRKATPMETQWDLDSAKAMEFGSAPLLVRTTAYLMALRSDQGWEMTTVPGSAAQPTMMTAHQMTQARVQR